MEFSGVSIILPTIRETTTFVTAVELLLKIVNHSDICEFIVVVCEKTKKESFKYIELGKKKAEDAGIPFSVIFQKKPFFGGALQDAFAVSKGSHVIIETPDLNTAPETLPGMIEIIKKHPGDIVSCSRWLPGGGFVNYNKIKMIWNQISQKCLRILYHSKVSDFTYGVHLAPTKLYQSINFHELKHPINLEQVVIPLRLGIHIYEVPAVCRTQEDDITVNPLLENFKYLRPAFYWRFAKHEYMVHPNIDWNVLVQELQS